MISAATRALCSVTLGVLTVTGIASAQQQARQPAAQAQPAEPAKDYNQRALEIYEFRKAAQSGPAPRPGNLLLQMLDVPQRAGARRRAQARRPVQAHHAGHRRAASTTRPSRTRSATAAPIWGPTNTS